MLDLPQNGLFMQDFLNEKCPLFQGIKTENMDSLLTCLCAKKKIFTKDNYIFLEGDAITEIGLLLLGGAQIVKDDFWGNRTIISHLSKGDLFGEAFAASGGKPSKVSVVATEKSEVLFIDFNKVTLMCPSSCDFHSQLIKNMLNILANKNIMLTDKIEFVTRKTTREKVLSYFSSIAKQQGSTNITIPFDRQGLADYLSVERSALSHELSLMKKEALIDFSKNNFILRK